MERVVNPIQPTKKAIEAKLPDGTSRARASLSVVQYVTRRGTSLSQREQHDHRQRNTRRVMGQTPMPWQLLRHRFHSIAPSPSRPPGPVPCSSGNESKKKKKQGTSGG
ncbi:hypothetical protein JDV02_009559 [Purpureocillium takamizusanense]|uniref:Uncharacterized protein n=1 Tax=Purpureocillium takamizusanense TaxID=2060973 RepID=A0A9Q8QP37_9HYPO|nr:uncharacterized protein JDV02_009559 [Purpureocillium takamizusanense]UNI23758.1 hypothetical protein JDV02_009559 [Purpureocillium takamizusanense]